MIAPAGSTSPRTTPRFGCGDDDPNHLHHDKLAPARPAQPVAKPQAAGDQFVAQAAADDDHIHGPDCNHPPIPEKPQRPGDRKYPNQPVRRAIANFFGWFGEFFNNCWQWVKDTGNWFTGLWRKRPA